MATLPASPPTLPSASAICPDGTATTTTSASVASPPSRPTAVTAWPARSQRRASPPPTLPLPSTKMFTLPPCRWPHRAAGPCPARLVGRGRPGRCGPSARPWRQPGPVGSALSTPRRLDPLDQLQALPAEVVRRPACAGPMGQYWGMRIVSPLPSATEIVYALGQEGRLVGVTDECDWPPQARTVQVVSRSALPADVEPAEIDRLVSASIGVGQPLYRLDTEAIR